MDQFAIRSMSDEACLLVFSIAEMLADIIRSRKIDIIRETGNGKSLLNKIQSTRMMKIIKLYYYTFKLKLVITII
jgi:hypothetical protein